MSSAQLEKPVSFSIRNIPKKIDPYETKKRISSQGLSRKSIFVLCFLLVK